MRNGWTTGRGAIAATAAVLLAGWCAPAADGAGSLELSMAQWQGERFKVAGLEGDFPAAVGHPARSAAVLIYQGRERLSAGLYRVRLTLRPSHVSDTVAWHGRLEASFGKDVPVSPASWQGAHFTRVGEPEVKTVDVRLPGGYPLALRLSALVEDGVFGRASAREALRSGAVRMPEATLIGEGDDGGADLGFELELELDPKTHFFFLLDRAEVRRLCSEAYVETVNVDKLRYVPGETLHGSVVLRRLSASAAGALRLYLEHGVAERELISETAVTLTEERTAVPVEVPLPQRELGYALVAEFVSAEGAERHEAAEYFTIADNFQRVLIGYAHPIAGETFRSAEALRGALAGMKRNYINNREIFFWGEEDMVELSPDDPYWFSGQTCYHMCKRGLVDYIRIAHELGISISTYGKFVLSGYLGWKAAYDYPFDHKEQYGFSIGMWEGCNVPELDRFMNKEFMSVPVVDEGVFGKEYGGLSFMPINPDPTPHNSRVAAEEMVRSIEMFDWDGVRWDGHPRGADRWGSSCGGLRNEKYTYAVQRKTQLLVRYFKDIVGARYPRFRHGYNYLHTQDEPFCEWAYEDFELDELCRGGGLLMNEAIRNSQSRTFAWLARNLQVEGDLCRERGGFMQGIFCDHVSERDTFVEQILYLAAGCRSYILGDVTLNRYATRYAAYTLDETLRRLAEPGNVLRPEGETSLWWDPFVYETVGEGENRQVVVNLLNIPREERITGMGSNDERFDLAPGSDPVAFLVSLPDHDTLVRARLIDPFTLAVEEVVCEGGRVAIPPIGIWRVLVLDLARRGDGPSLADQWGAPRTLGVRRKNVEAEPSEPAPLDVEKSVVDVNKRMTHLFPESGERWWEEPAEFGGLSWEARNAAILATRKPVEHYIKGYPYGLQLPRDLELREAPPFFGDLTPDRNGVLDVFYARGGMDYRLRWYDAFARLDRVQVREARYVAPFSGKHHAIVDNITPGQMSQYDVLLYVDVPHPAMGVENCYALVDYVRAGGGVLFTGGEYAFGKGRYAHTVLERELLPVICVQQVDGRYVEEPLAIEPGPDFAELGVELDFGAKPAFWCWNQVALRDDVDVKVFLKSGNRPILVGRQLGEGRVACFLAMHRGKSEDGVTAFFDWSDWPELAAATVRWVAPAAPRVEVRPATFTPDELASLREAAEGSLMEDLVDSALSDNADALDMGGGAEPGGEEAMAAVTLDAAALRERVALLRRLTRGEGGEVSALLAEQLATVANLPHGVRFDALAFVRAHPFPELAETAQRAAASGDAHVRGCGYQLLALAGDPAFARMLRAGPGALEVRRQDRNRYLSLAVALYTRDDLAAMGRRRIGAWDAREQATIKRYTEGKGFSLAAPETLCLDSESLFARIGWLAYMAQWEPATYAAALVRQWAMLAQYRDYCDRTTKNLRESLSKPPVSAGQRLVVEERTKELAYFRQLLTWMERVTRPRVEAVLRTHPEPVARGLAAGRFLAEVKQGINLLAGLDVAESRAVLEPLREARHPLLSAFARARLGRSGP